MGATGVEFARLPSTIGVGGGFKIAQIAFLLPIRGGIREHGQGGEALASGCDQRAALPRLVKRCAAPDLADSMGSALNVFGRTHATAAIGTTAFSGGRIYRGQPKSHARDLEYFSGLGRQERAMSPRFGNSTVSVWHEFTTAVGGVCPRELVLRVTVTATISTAGQFCVGKGTVRELAAGLAWRRKFALPLGECNDELYG